MIDSNNEKDKSVKTDRISKWDWLILAIGNETFSGATNETLNNSIALHSELEYKPPNIKWLKFGIIGVDISFPSHDLTYWGKDVLRDYEKITTEFGVVTEREAVTGIRYTAGRFSSGLKLYPLSIQHEGNIRPFLGIGASFWIFETKVEGVYERKKTKTGLDVHYRFGIDFHLPKYGFIRFEYMGGGVPDLNAQALPEIRKINGGGFNTFRIGFGYHTKL